MCRRSLPLLQVLLRRLLMLLQLLRLLRVLLLKRLVLGFISLLLLILLMFLVLLRLQFLAFLVLLLRQFLLLLLVFLVQLGVAGVRRRRFFVCRQILRMHHAVVRWTIRGHRVRLPRPRSFRVGPFGRVVLSARPCPGLPGYCTAHRHPWPSPRYR